MSLSSSYSSMIMNNNANLNTAAQCPACQQAGGECACGIFFRVLQKAKCTPKPMQKAKRNTDDASDAASVASTKRATGRRECFYCRKKGHVMSDCPAKKAAQECFFCFQKGHIKGDCAKLRAHVQAKEAAKAAKAAKAAPKAAKAALPQVVQMPIPDLSNHAAWPAL